MRKLTPDEVAALESTQAPKHSVEVVNLGGVTPTNQPFLWWPYLPLGRVVIVAGAPGHGKSQFASLVTSMATRGQFYPGDVTEPSRVLMLCAEDDLATTVVPRLLAVNADVSRVDSINVVTEYPDGLTVKGLIKIPTDTGIIHQWVKANVDARLIVLDPVASFFDRDHNMLINQDSRDALGPLVSIAEQYGVTVVIILHLNKSESKDFASRIAESHGFQALARSVLAFGPHPDDTERERGSRKVIALTKANLVKPGNFAIECEIRSVTLPAFTPPIETSELALIGKCNIDAETLLLSASERSTRFDAGVWLAEFVGDGWKLVADVRKAGLSDGFNWKTLDRIARDHDYKREKQPGVAHGPWWIGAPHAPARAMPGTGKVESLEGQDTQDPQGSQGANGTSGGELNQGSQDSPYPGSRGRAREGNGFNLDEYREWEQRRLGEGDDEDEA